MRTENRCHLVPEIEGMRVKKEVPELLLPRNINTTLRQIPSMDTTVPAKEWTPRETNIQFLIIRWIMMEMRRLQNIREMCQH